MRTALVPAMWAGELRGPAWGALRRAAGGSGAPRAAGVVSGQRLQPGGPRRPGPAGGEPFPGTPSREALLDVLRAAVVDRRGPLVTLNKPQGLPVTGRPDELTLVSVLPELGRALGLGQQELQVVRAAERETSGLVLLSSCPQTTVRLQKFFANCRRVQRPTATYWAVTNGVPASAEGRVQTALRLVHVDGVKVAVPVETPSRKMVREGARRTLSHFRVLDTGSGCALVQLQPLTAFPSQLQVHMVSQLCPILGDHMYSARVGSVLGQRFLLSAENATPRPQVLDAALLERLHLAPAQAARLPLHLHLLRLHLPGATARDAPAELLAPPPPHFSRTLQDLGLRPQ